ncbi:MAG: hypothetical protein HC927_10840 [Deltaproteobacteria bacterium]|nr:hypothetical protein [Deltaproteobacteria bacterium]
MLSLPEAEGAAWVIGDRIELLEWTREWLDDADAGSIPTTIYVDDYEDDGELELLVRFRNEIMCPGGGANEVTTLMLIELAETPPRIALQTEIDHALGSGAAQTKAKLIHEDLDGDAHRDLRIVYRSSGLDEDGAPTQADGEEERRWRWDPQADGWVRLAAEGKWVEYARGEGCEW